MLSATTKMILTEKQKASITAEHKQWLMTVDEYCGNDKEKRQSMGQFYTPPELTIRMLEKFDNLNGTVFDPTSGCGNLLMGAMIVKLDLNKDWLGRCKRPWLDIVNEIHGNDIDENILKMSKNRFWKYFKDKNISNVDEIVLIQILNNNFMIRDILKPGILDD
jgi:type I restriction-modification system DNA methylase subunit